MIANFGDFFLPQKSLKMRDVLEKMRECGKLPNLRDFPHDCGMVDTYVLSSFSPVSLVNNHLSNLGLAALFSFSLVCPHPAFLSLSARVSSSSQGMKCNDQTFICRSKSTSKACLQTSEVILFTGFADLLIEDQMSLLKASFMELNVLRLAYRCVQVYCP